MNLGMVMISDLTRSSGFTEGAADKAAKKHTKTVLDFVHSIFNVIQNE